VDDTVVAVDHDERRAVEPVLVDRRIHDRADGGEVVLPRLDGCGHGGRRLGRTGGENE
jgi:hypothetical protein